MHLEFRPVQLNQESDTEGRLVFVDGRFAALLSRLSEQHGDDAGRWFLEFGLGALAAREENFVELKAAERWISERLHA